MAQTVPYQSPQRSQYTSVLSDETLPRGGYLQLRVDSAVQYADNLVLTDDPDQQVSSGGLELSPGFYASYSGEGFQGAIDYSLIGRAWEESDFDDVTHELAANGRWAAVADLFYVDGTAAYFPSVIDPSLGMNPGNAGLLGSSNLADTASATMTPTLRKRFNGLEQRTVVATSGTSTWTTRRPRPSTRTSKIPLTRWPGLPSVPRRRTAT